MASMVSMSPVTWQVFVRVWRRCSFGGLAFPIGYLDLVVVGFVPVAVWQAFSGAQTVVFSVGVIAMLTTYLTGRYRWVRGMAFLRAARTGPIVAGIAAVEDGRHGPVALHDGQAVEVRIGDDVIAGTCVAGAVGAGERGWSAIRRDDGREWSGLRLGDELALRAESGAVVGRLVVEEVRSVW